MVYDNQKKIIDANHTWNLRRQKSILAPAKAKSLSPNGRWLILEYSIHQDPEGRYESEIDDADWKEIAGSRFKWGEGDANIILGESILNLERLALPEIIKILEQFYQ